MKRRLTTRVVKIGEGENMSRILVDIRGTSNSCFMRTEDGKVITLSVGDTYHIGNQMRPYMVVKRNDGLWLEKYGDHGNIIEEESIPKRGKYLLATTSGSARNGVFHRYYIPKDPLEKFIKCDLKLPLRIITRVDDIKGSYYISEDRYIMTDGETDDHEYNVIVKSGTYIISFEDVEHFNGSKDATVEKIWITPSASVEEVIKKITWVLRYPIKDL